MLIRAKTLKGYTLDANDGEVGKVHDFYFDDRHRAIRYLGANTGSWLMDRQVLISPYVLDVVNQEDRYITVELTKSQIEDGPSLDSDKPVSRQFEESSYGHYGDPNLRSIHDVSSRNIQATDGEIGHVEDFIFDDKMWAIRYLIIDTRNWWPGKKVLISPEWIEHVSWSESKVFINLTRGAIKQSPEYTEGSLLTRDYETRLHQHYDRQGYWIDETSSELLNFALGNGGPQASKKDQLVR